jgi:hypothetical protein
MNTEIHKALERQTADAHSPEKWHLKELRFLKVPSGQLNRNNVRVAEVNLLQTEFADAGLFHLFLFNAGAAFLAFEGFRGRDFLPFDNFFLGADSRTCDDSEGKYTPETTDSETTS